MSDNNRRRRSAPVQERRGQPPPNKRIRPPKKKKKRLENNKAWFKFLIPKDRYLEDVRIGEIDIPFLMLIVVLLVFGVVMMYSASYAWAIHKGQEHNYYFIKQLQHIGIGLGAMLVLSSRIFDYHILNNKFIPIAFFVFCTVLMLLVFVPGIGIREANAARWIRITEGFRFQPSEFMKLAMIILYAYIMSHLPMNNFLFGICLNAGIAVIVAVMTVAQRHISATAIILAIAVVMICVCGTDRNHFVLMCIVGVIGVAAVSYVLYKTGRFDYISDRFISMTHTFDDEYKDTNWQTRNSVIAIGSGGLFGLGLGNSRQKFLYLPEAQNDFVFAIVCEELGFVGAAVVIILFLMLIFRGFSIAENAPDKFGMMLVTGLVFQIGIQAILNIGVVTNAIPNTGISLPFFSYGGTALILQLVEMGLVLNVSRQSIPREESPDTEKELKQIQQAKDKLR